MGKPWGVKRCCAANYAYETMFRAFALTKAGSGNPCLRVVSQKTGIHGMLGGQSVDVENDGKPLKKRCLTIFTEIRRQH